MIRRSPFWVLRSRFVFRFGSMFRVRGSPFGVRPTNLERWNFEPITEREHEQRTVRTEKRERYVHHAIALAIILVAEGHLSSQVRTATPLLPLKQTAYIKASNADAYDYF